MNNKRNPQNNNTTDNVNGSRLSSPNRFMYCIYTVDRGLYENFFGHDLIRSDRSQTLCLFFLGVFILFSSYFHSSLRFSCSVCVRCVCVSVLVVSSGIGFRRLISLSHKLATVSCELLRLLCSILQLQTSIEEK